MSAPRAPSHGVWVIALSVAACVAVPPKSPELVSQAPPPASFVVEGQPLCFVGANSYYPIYKPRPMVDALFDAARALDLKVLRVWGMLDRGSLDGSVPNADGSGQKEGVYFQYWDVEQRRPAYNDGEDGLARLDYALAAAAERDLKLIVVLVNNWRAFGGIDQYLMWYGRNEHHEFFTAPELKQAYKDWVAHVVLRTNSVNGRSYRDDPSIFAWELANEPRCRGGGSFDTAPDCRPELLSRWASEMSTFVKSLDSNHLVSVGDEGFLDRGGEHWAYRGGEGVDHATLTALWSVDFGTFHLYPDEWGAPEPFGERWITDHVGLARELGKPTILEEYGLKLEPETERPTGAGSGWSRRLAGYRSWNDTLLGQGGNAGLAWLLAGDDASGAPYPDYDHYTFYRDDAAGKLLARYAQAFATAPACRAHETETWPRSPFVSVTHRAELVAQGWLESATR